MLNSQFERTALLLGTEAIDKLSTLRIAVFGVGGVGGFVTEALARSGIGALDIIDNDTVALSNINRQIIATHSTIGRSKVEVMKERILDINPEIQVTTYSCFFTPETADQFDFSQYDYVVDAIDTITGKLELIVQCNKTGTPIISSMGAGNKLDPTRFEVADIYNTSMCPLAKVMRKELKARDIKACKVVYSKEQPIKPLELEIAASNKRQTPGSIAFVPSVVGLIIAGEVIKDLIK